jgi:hypothetical protein
MTSIESVILEVPTAFALDGLDECFDLATASASWTGPRTHSGCCACCAGGR